MKKKILGLIFAMAAVMLLMPIIASAEASGTCGENVVWVLDDKGNLTISGEGEMLGGYRYAWREAKTAVIEEGVTGICEEAFSFCSKLTSITIPDSVTNIGESAFYNCSSLTDITLPKGITSIGKYVFYDCSSLKSITIPDGVTSIGLYAFYNCISLTSVTMPNSVTRIDNNAFPYNSKIISITYKGDFKELGKVALSQYSFIKTKTICNDITVDKWGKCGENVVWGIDNEGTCTLSGEGEMTSAPVDSISDEIKTVVINDGVTNIAYYAFGRCKNLTSASIPNSITSIRKRAFDGCSSLVSINIPASVTSIEESAFSGCSSLTNITIPKSVTSIGDSAFKECENLSIYYEGKFKDLSMIEVGTKTITVKTCCSDITVNIWGRSGTNILWGIDDERTLIICGEGEARDSRWTSNIEKVVIDDGITSIGEGAFSGGSLKSITIPSGVKSIGSNAFKNCKSLTEVILSEGLTSIGNRAFEGCTSLESITIPSSVTSMSGAFLLSGLKSVAFAEGTEKIADQAFESCYSLTDVTISSSVTSIGIEAFTFCTGLADIVIPEGVTSIGKNAFYRSGLKNVTILCDSAYIDSGAFKDCYSLGNVFLDDIGAWCGIEFADPDANPMKRAENVYLNGAILTDIIIPDGVEKIGDYQFSNVSSIVTAKIPDSVKKIGMSAFSGFNLSEITIPENVEEIGRYAFEGMKKLTTINYNAINCVSIETSAFYQSRYNVKNINIGEKVKSIPDRAFDNFDGVQTVTLGSSVERIGEGAFYSCWGLIKIFIPNSVTEIGANAFKSCIEFKKVEYGGSEEEWNNINIHLDNNEYLLGAKINYNASPEDAALTGDDYFRYSINADGTITVTGNLDKTLSVLKIPEVIDDKTVTSIGNSAFENRTGLKKVIIPKTVQAIYTNAFYECSELKEVIIQNGTTSIQSYSFYKCSNLESITIPESVVYVGSSAFYGCDNLAAVYYGGTAAQLQTLKLGSYNDKFLNAYIYCDGVVPSATAEVTKSESKTAYTFKITTEQKHIKGSVYAAVYDKDGGLLKLWIVPLNAEATTFVPVRKTDNDSTIKVMIWSEDFQPLVEANVFKVN